MDWNKEKGLSSDLTKQYKAGGLEYNNLDEMFCPLDLKCSECSECRSQKNALKVQALFDQAVSLIKSLIHEYPDQSEFQT